MQFERSEWVDLCDPQYDAEDEAETLAELLLCPVEEVVGSNGANTEHTDSLITYVVHHGTRLCQYGDGIELFRLDGKHFVVSYVEGARLLATTKQDLYYVEKFKL